MARDKKRRLKFEAPRVLKLSPAVIISRRRAWRLGAASAVAVAVLRGPPRLLRGSLWRAFLPVAVCRLRASP